MPVRQYKIYRIYALLRMKTINNKNQILSILLVALVATAILFSSCSKRGGEPSVGDETSSTTVNQSTEGINTLGSGLTSEQASIPGPSNAGKAIRVSTLNNPQAYAEFQKNVQLVQQQRQLAANLQQRLETERDIARKTELQEQFESVMSKLNENNQKMMQTYGFTLNRNYTVVVEKSSIYMAVSDEEAAQILERQKEGQ